MEFFPQAYKSLVAKEGTEGALPGLGLTEEQLFFIGFAQVGQNKFMIYIHSKCPFKSGYRI